MSFDPLYSDQFFISLRRKIRVGIGLFILSLLLCGVATTILIINKELTILTTVSAGLLTALPFFFGYALRQKYILPAFRTTRVLQELNDNPPKIKEGRFIQYRDGHFTYKGILMHAIRLDTGLMVRREPVPEEVYLPACIEKLPFKEGTLISFETRERIMTSCSPLPEPVSIASPNAGYQILGSIYLFILIVAALIWGAFYSFHTRLAAEPVLQVAVSSLYHSENVMPDLTYEFSASDSVGLAFSYSNSSNPEQTAAYLSTFGIWEADIVLLEADLFEGIFDGDAEVLSPAICDELSNEVGFPLIFVRNQKGQAIGIVLFDPEESEYSNRFSLIKEWIKIQSGEQYLAVLNPRSKDISIQGLKALLLALTES